VEAQVAVVQETAVTVAQVVVLQPILAVRMELELLDKVTMVELVTGVRLLILVAAAVALVQ
jgi:hypothetical protein